MTIRNPKMHPHNQFEIPNLNNIRYAQDTIILESRSEVKVTVTQKWYVTLAIPKSIQKLNLGFLPQRIYKICIGVDADSRN